MRLVNRDDVKLNLTLVFRIEFVKACGL
jgi:hypothetical protein